MDNCEGIIGVMSKYGSKRGYKMAVNLPAIHIM